MEWEININGETVKGNHQKLSFFTYMSIRIEENKSIKSMVSVNWNEFRNYQLGQTKEKPKELKIRVKFKHGKQWKFYSFPVL